MHLSIYISRHCWGCREAQKIAEQMHQSYPELTVELIDVDRAEVETPDKVFATPTYLLNGRIVSLGNPRPEALREMIEDELGPFS